MTGESVDISVKSVASHTRRKIASFSIRRSDLKGGEHLQERETGKQEEETGRETRRGGEVEVKEGRGKERKISLQTEYNLLTPEKKLVE